MNRLFITIIVLSIVFILTYKPESRRLEYFKPFFGKDCEDNRYQALQFAETNKTCPTHEVDKLGAIYEKY